MSTPDVVAALDDLDLRMLWVAPEPDTVPHAPVGPWVLVPLSDGATLIGGSDRGTFATYGVFDDDSAVRALRHLLGTSAPLRQLERPEREQLSADAEQLGARLAQAGQPLSPADVPVGTALDHIGFDSGHTAFLLDTAFAERSSPPTDLQLPRTGYLVRQPLPETTAVGPVVPWFGQPGGGILVGFERPLRFYVDTGHLEPFAP